MHCDVVLRCLHWQRLQYVCVRLVCCLSLHRHQCPSSSLVRSRCYRCHRCPALPLNSRIRCSHSPLSPQCCCPCPLCLCHPSRLDHQCLCLHVRRRCQCHWRFCANVCCDWHGGRRLCV